MDYSEIVAFHGHACPGLAIGYRMACAGMAALGAARAADDEIVAMVENDACGVDAVQFVTGCTFGKGNLHFRDYGKYVYTFYSRTAGTGVRVVFQRNGLPPALAGDKAALADYILSAPADTMMTVATVPFALPEQARTRPSENCAACGESVMETRLSEIDGLRFCIPCAEKHGANG